MKGEKKLVSVLIIVSRNPSQSTLKSPMLDKKLLKSNSAFLGIGSPRFHPYKADNHILKSASSDFLNHSQTYGDLPLVNDSILDLFPALGAHSKRDDAKRSLLSPQMSSKKSGFSSPLFATSTKQKNYSLVDFSYDTSIGESRYLEPSVINSVAPILKAEKPFKKKKQQPVLTINAQKLMPSNEQFISFNPSSKADMLAIKLAQHAVDLSMLPKRVKLIRDLSDEVIANMMDFENPVMPDVYDEIAHTAQAAELASSILNGGSPPVKIVVLNALTAPVPRSAGTPTNVNVPHDVEMDHKTLKRLRNRISASRCRLRKRIWTLGLEKCEKELSNLTLELEEYVDELEHERASLMRVLSMAGNTSDVYGNQ